MLGQWPKLVDVWLSISPRHSTHGGNIRFLAAFTGTINRDRMSMTDINRFVNACNVRKVIRKIFRPLLVLCQSNCRVSRVLKTIESCPVSLPTVI